MSVSKLASIHPFTALSFKIVFTLLFVLFYVFYMSKYHPKEGGRSCNEFSYCREDHREGGVVNSLLTTQKLAQAAYSERLRQTD
jgi:hypothetical protein